MDDINKKLEEIHRTILYVCSNLNFNLISLGYLVSVIGFFITASIFITFGNYTGYLICFGGMVIILIFYYKRYKKYKEWVKRVSGE